MTITKIDYIMELNNMLSKEEKEYYEKLIKALQEARKDLKELNKKLGRRN